MATCDTCGNDDDKAFTITQGDRTGTSDSFECAAHAMAPSCAYCDCRILGHGVAVGESMYCCAHCAHCAEYSGAEGVADRVRGRFPYRK